MTLYRVCDICKEELPESYEDIYRLELYPKLQSRDINSNKISVLKTDVCEECAKAIAFFVDARTKAYADFRRRLYDE